MSCASPFVFEESVTIIETKSSVGVSGSFTLPGYTLPSTQLCWPTWKAPYSSCKWGGWQNTKLKCKWVKGSSGWCCCWSTPNVEIWPTLTFTGSVFIPFVFESSAGVEISVEEPPEPFQANSITIEECDCSLVISGAGINTNITINILPTPITIVEINGSFSINVPLYGFSSSATELGIKYTLSVETSLLFCLEPVPPVGWINLELDCSITAYENDVINYTVGFKLNLPIVSVED